MHVNIILEQVIVCYYDALFKVVAGGRSIMTHYCLLNLTNMAFLVLNRDVLWDLSTLWILSWPVGKNVHNT